MGHGRGKTESFKTYSKGADMRELSEYVELVDYAIANCWHKKTGHVSVRLAIKYFLKVSEI